MPGKLARRSVSCFRCLWVFDCSHQCARCSRLLLPPSIASAGCSAAHNVRGYPTLLLFKGKGAEGVKYQGARDVNAFTNWLGEQL